MPSTGRVFRPSVASVTLPPLVINSGAVTPVWASRLPASIKGDPTHATPSARTPLSRGSTNSVAPLSVNLPSVVGSR